MSSDGIFVIDNNKIPSHLESNSWIRIVTVTPSPLIVTEPDSQKKSTVAAVGSVTNGCCARPAFIRWWLVGCFLVISAARPGHVRSVQFGFCKTWPDNWSAVGAFTIQGRYRCFQSGWKNTVSTRGQRSLSHSAQAMWTVALVDWSSHSNAVHQRRIEQLSKFRKPNTTPVGVFGRRFPPHSQLMCESGSLPLLSDQVVWGRGSCESGSWCTASSWRRSCCPGGASCCGL